MVIYGPDASKWQGDVDWGPVDQLAAFGWEQVSEGTIGVNPRWGPEKPQMKARAAASGFIPGGYLFLRAGRGAEQADYFAAAAGDMSGFGIAVDAEPRRDASGKVISSPGPADARACVARLRALFPGHPIGGYLPRWYWGDRATDFCDWLWASHYVTGGPATPAALYAKVPASWWGGYGGLPISLLQFTDKALIAGVPGPCDCSAFRGNPAQLATLLLPRRAAAPPKEKTMALRRVWIPSPNYSRPRGMDVRLIVLHTTEGAQTFRSLGEFFSRSSAQVSSQVGIDDTPGVIGEYVHRPDAAWTAAAGNRPGVHAELCTPRGAADGWSRATWMGPHRQMLINAAAWIAEEAAHFGIPIVGLSPAQAQGGSRGVCQHSDLGAMGGGHHDCGPGFPMDYVLQLARGGGQPPKPKPDDHELSDEEPTMQIQFTTPPSGAPYATIVVPNYYADGNARARFGAGEATHLRADLMGKGDTQTVDIGGEGDNKGAQGFKIPKDCTIFTLRRDSGADWVAMTFSK
jgi:GH25 family lysozyme M1 (1,4-beta-N-acetylmuramidase)